MSSPFHRQDDVRSSSFTFGQVPSVRAYQIHPTSRQLRGYIYRLLVGVGFIAAICHPSTLDAGWRKPAGGPSASGAPEIILTFDDGPHQEYTSTILDELQSRDIKAMFFWVGHRVLRGKKTTAQVDLVRRAVREGHLIANHTVNHVNLCATDAEEAAHEIDANAHIYQRLTGLPIIFFRSPYGARCKQLLRMLKERGLSHLHWDIDPREWFHRDAEQVRDYVVRKLRNLNGRAVVLMHDTKAASARALPDILNWIDEENRRRQLEGDQPTIRILDASTLVNAYLTPAMPHWFGQTATRYVYTLSDTLSRLVP